MSSQSKQRATSHLAASTTWTQVLRLCMAVAALAWPGCGSPPANSGVQAAADTQELTFDVVSVLADSGGGDLKIGSDQVTAEDAGSDTPTGQKVCNFAAPALQGQPGWPCKGPGDCDSGLCVDTPEGKTCTVKCTDCCPSAWSCAQLGDVDPVFACVPRALHICDPCSVDSDCASQGDAALCLDLGDAGRFCGSDCSSGQSCPDGYTCKDAQGVKGSGKQCVRTLGECSCSKKAVEAGATTVCSSTNAAGSCKGSRKCTSAGLSACNAATALAEVCNGSDDDCDGQTDEAGASGCQDYWVDADSDGFGAQKDKGGKAACLCGPGKPYTAKAGTDCEDGNPDIKPGATEICDDLDNDCDGKTDEGCDDDLDGWCDQQLKVVGQPKVCAKGVGDCDDSKAAAHPGADEVCGNNIDDDCNGATDTEENASGCAKWYFDGDKDSWGSDAFKCLCGPTAAYPASQTGDCADGDPKVNPATQEVCGNGKDDNCDKAQDEENAQGCLSYFADADLDGFGGGAGKCLCAKSAAYPASKGGDCDDNNGAVYPTQVESCNGVDDDCDGATDEDGATGCTNLYADLDNDGYGNTDDGKCLCSKTGKYKASQSGDCDDAKPDVHPGVAELCNGWDDNCNGIADEAGAQGCTTYYADMDKDGAGNPAVSACMCGKSPPYTASAADDCDDTKADVHPGAAEKCNNQDDNCDGKVDEESAAGCSSFYQDVDGDTFGAGSAKCLCAPAGTWTAIKAGDCDDNAKSTNPAATELCVTAGVDDNCNGQTDEAGTKDCTNFFIDIDVDGWGAAKAPPSCLCKANFPYTAIQGGDCNDSDETVYPGAKEVCDGKDTNCNNVPDDEGAAGCKAYYVDADNDAFGVTANTKCLCSSLGAYTTTKPGDCNDANDKINPGQAEICNGVDDNCNGVTDSDAVGAATYFQDLDNDGVGTGQGVVQCGPSGAYKVTIDGDCNDNDPAIYKGKAEVCDGKDNDCDSAVDNASAAQLCGTANNAATVCGGGKCSLKCSGTYFDVDTVFSNGCECAADVGFGVHDQCGKAEDLGKLPDTGTLVTRTGNIMPGEAGDWYKFTAVDTPDTNGACDQFNERVTLASNPGSAFAFDVYRGSCSAVICTGVTSHNWATNFYGAKPSGPGTSNNVPIGDYAPSPAPEKGGECKCTGAPGIPGMNVCSDNTADFYVRVFRIASAPASCAYYTIQFANGP